MKTIIGIGDVHGLTYWKNVVKNNPNCRYVFLGDYLDPYDFVYPDDLIDNLKDILKFKKEYPKDVILLLGNHDLHYFTDKIARSTRFNANIATKIKDWFLDNRQLFQFAYQEKNYVFTHAGIDHDWFINDFKGNIESNIAQQLNNPTKEQEIFLYGCGYSRGGDMKVGGIFWADKTDLSNPLKGFIQVVGHNRVEGITEREKNGGKIIFCDCLFNEKFLKIATIK